MQNVSEHPYIEDDGDDGLAELDVDDASSSASHHG